MSHRPKTLGNTAYYIPFRHWHCSLGCLKFCGGLYDLAFALLSSSSLATFCLRLFHLSLEAGVAPWGHSPCSASLPLPVLSEMLWQTPIHFHILALPCFAQVALIASVSVPHNPTFPSSSPSWHWLTCILSIHAVSSMRADTSRAWHVIITNTNHIISGKRTWGKGVSFNQCHTGLRSGPSKNSKQDAGWGNSLVAGVIRPKLMAALWWWFVPLFLTG